ncbi:hypothetical protein PVAP13_7KG415380 [Panicum virgatum]|uniref:Uncharacterized protein n=1 Tax=Panicum virgatum TaxID=38727 RepID=A0A8T0QQE8_PANVG|nr:hypothetical protein PVAP13_7KG415380 [Panicum virgatum]
MTAAHVPYFIAFVFLQPYFPVPHSAESATSYPAACCTLSISLFTATHSGSDGRRASGGRRTTSRQAGEQHIATELEMHDASRICYLLVAVISNVSSIC